MLRRLTTSLPLRSLLLQSSTLPACQAPTPSVSFLARSFSGLSLRPTPSISPSSALAKLFPQQAFGLQGSPLLGQIRTAYVEKMKTYKPTSPGIRFRKIVDRSHLWKGKPMRHLTVALRKTGGRNNHGHITVRHRGGGHKRRYRLVDFKRNKEAENTVVRLEYDPNRSAWIALLKNTKTEEYSYILCPKNLEPGDKVHSGESVEIKIGNSCPLKNMPVGTIIHNIEMKPGRGGQLARTAGAYAQLLKTGPEGFAYVRLPSTEVRMVSVHCRATVGSVSNSLHKNTVLGKAGALRWKGRRPHVRGVAMNPIDHPHGGGEGKGAPGRPSVSPWGKLAKSGKKTRNRHKFSNKFVVEPRKRGKNRK